MNINTQDQGRVKFDNFNAFWKHDVFIIMGGAAAFTKDGASRGSVNLRGEEGPHLAHVIHVGQERDLPTPFSEEQQNAQQGTVNESVDIKSSYLWGPGQAGCFRSFWLWPASTFLAGPCRALPFAAGKAISAFCDLAG